MTESRDFLGISTSDLKSSAPTFDAQSRKLRAAAAKLEEKLEALGPCWGGDKQGQEFAKNYTPNKRSIEKVASILSPGLASIFEAMQDMADGHVEGEEVIRGMFTSDGSTLGTPLHGKPN